MKSPTQQNTYSSELLPATVSKNLTDIIARIANQQWAMWLDSCNSDHIDNRYDIFVWHPLKTITTIGNKTIVNDSTTKQSDVVLSDPLQIVQAEINKSFEQEDISPNKLPFKGGAVGYFSYDLGRHFEKLPNTTEHDLKIPDMAVGIYDRAIIVDKKANKTYLFCQNQKRQPIESELLQQLSEQLNLSSFKLTSPWQANMTKAQYQAKFEKIHQYLLSGDCYQINLAQRFNANYCGAEFSAYLTLREQNNAPFSAYLHIANCHILSISPERFLQVNENKVQTKPIKGTRARSADKSQDIRNKKALANASKDRAENLMIVDLLRNDISKACEASSVQVPKLFDIESFPSVHHLVSTVEGMLSPDKTSLDLLRGAFPGGSITGAPKVRAMEIIEELEPHRRNIYCGSIGYISSCGNMDTSITIRTLTCYNNQIFCSAGGGIVADSVAQDEYQETLDKVNKILPVLSSL